MTYSQKLQELQSGQLDLCPVLCTYVGYSFALPDGRTVTTERSYPTGISREEYHLLVWQACRAARGSPLQLRNRLTMFPDEDSSL